MPPTMIIGSLYHALVVQPVPSTTGQNDEDTHLRPYAPRHAQTLRHPSDRPLIKGRAGRVRVGQARSVAACRAGSVWKRVCRTVPRPSERAPHLSMGPHSLLPRGPRTLVYHGRHAGSIGSKTDLRIHGATGREPGETPDSEDPGGSRATTYLARPASDLGRG